MKADCHALGVKSVSIFVLVTIYESSLDLRQLVATVRFTWSKLHIRNRILTDPAKHPFRYTQSLHPTMFVKRQFQHSSLRHMIDAAFIFYTLFLLFFVSKSFCHTNRLNISLS